MIGSVSRTNKKRVWDGASQTPARVGPMSGTNHARWLRYGFKVKARWYRDYSPLATC